MAEKDKDLEKALEKFRKNEVTTWKAAKIAGVSLSEFLDILAERRMDFHYGMKELQEDFEGLNE